MMDDLVIADANLYYTSKHSKKVSRPCVIF